MFTIERDFKKAFITFFFDMSCYSLQSDMCIPGGDTINTDVHLRHNKGPFIFYEVGGAGGIWGGGSPQKNRLKGGAIPKKTEGRGGHAKYFSS